MPSCFVHGLLAAGRRPGTPGFRSELRHEPRTGPRRSRPTAPRPRPAGHRTRPGRRAPGGARGGAPRRRRRGADRLPSRALRPSLLPPPGRGGPLAAGRAAAVGAGARARPPRRGARGGAGGPGLRGGGPGRQLQHRPRLRRRRQPPRPLPETAHPRRPRLPREVLLHPRRRGLSGLGHRLRPDRGGRLLGFVVPGDGAPARARRRRAPALPHRHRQRTGPARVFLGGRLAHGDARPRHRQRRLRRRPEPDGDGRRHDLLRGQLRLRPLRRGPRAGRGRGRDRVRGSRLWRRVRELRELFQFFRDRRTDTYRGLLRVAPAASGNEPQ